MRTVEMTLEEVLTSYDWAEVFADDSSGNTTKGTDGRDLTFPAHFA